MLGRELTKRHQEFLRGSARRCWNNLGNPRGEITVVVGPSKTSHWSIDQVFAGDSVAQAVAKFGQLTNSGRSRRQAMTEAATSV